MAQPESATALAMISPCVLLTGGGEVFDLKCLCNQWHRNPEQKQSAL
jgi:hypothetical protein